jgi:hypothetical protein
MLGKKVVRHDCTPEVRQAFRATLRSASLADIDLVYYESTPMRDDVTVRHVAHANADELLVRRQIAGAFVAEQDSREAVLAEDETSIMRLVRARRLDRCRRALEDTSQTHRTVSEIAYG